MSSSIQIPIHRLVLNERLLLREVSAIDAASYSKLSILQSQRYFTRRLYFKVFHVSKIFVSLGML